MRCSGMFRCAKTSGKRTSVRTNKGDLWNLKEFLIRDLGKDNDLCLFLNNDIGSFGKHRSSFRLYIQTVLSNESKHTRLWRTNLLRSNSLYGSLCERYRQAEFKIYWYCRFKRMCPINIRRQWKTATPDTRIYYHKVIYFELIKIPVRWLEMIYLSYSQRGKTSRFSSRWKYLFL